MDNKMKMAHEWAMGSIDAGYVCETDMLVKEAWKYSDAMQAEADKRLKPSNSRELDWQPDWSQAQPCMKYFAVDADGKGYFYSYKPVIKGGYDYWGAFGELEGTGKSCDNHNYQGYWRNSLRRRPE